MSKRHESSATRPETRATTDGHHGSSAADTDEIVALRAIVEGTVHSTGEEFFQTLVRHLAHTVGAHYALVAEFASPATTERVRTISFWARDHIAENVEWDLAGTPCEDVVRGNLCHYPTAV